MKNTMKVLGCVALVAIIGFGMTACNNGSTDDGGFDGTWHQGYVGSEFGFTFSGTSVTQFDNGQGWTAQGTFSYTDTTITFTFPSFDNVYTMNYVLTDTYLELIRQNATDDWWTGQFYKK